MVTDRRETGNRYRALGVAILASAVLALVPRTDALGDEGAVIRLTQAERGSFNVGASRGEVRLAADPAAGGDVLKLDYTVPTGTAFGIWTKGFPEDFSAGSIDVVRPFVRSADADAARQIAVALEIKGTAGTQRIPLDVGTYVSPTEHRLDWSTIGAIKEVVVSVAHAGEGDPAVGTLWIDVRFSPLTPLRKLALSPPARFAGVVLAGLVAAGFAAFLRWVGGGRPGAIPVGGLARDLLQGAGVVAIAALALGINAVGGMEPLEVSWVPVWLALAGAAIGEWWTVGLTGRHVTPGEALRDALATGLLAASVGPLSILQAPATWSDLLRLSQPVAAALVCLYHGANAIRLASSGKHMGGVAGGVIVGTPYAVGWLLLLESPTLIRSLSDAMTGGLLAGHPDLASFIGRVGVLFIFNQIVANALGLATRRWSLRSLRSHLAILAVAIGAVAGPWVAWLGSGASVAAWPSLVRWLAVVATTVVSQAGLWAEAYLLTGLVLDAIHGVGPSTISIAAHPTLGLKKGMVYSGAFMTILGVVALLSGMPQVRRLADADPMALGLLAGAFVFPLVKTIVETFDGSPSFFRRLAASYCKPMLYARGTVVGFGLGFAFGRDMPAQAMSTRILFGFLIGVAGYAGMNLVGDALSARGARGRVQSWRVYLVQGMLGGAVGAALGFYLDTAQVGVILEKFHRYVDPGQAARLYDVYPLLSKWGYIRLGDVAGGPSLLFAEALAGVISWSIPSWLFAINRTFMAAYFDRDPAPIRSLFTRAGFVQLVENMIGVLRWGLWMSPIINSFLRPVGDPTWYNQDGAIRTGLAIVHEVTSTPAEFRSWSLNVFIALLAYDWVRILIWLDHFGLRVATLVNLSFLGMDRLDRRLARFLAPASTARCIPESVKRFTTWAPLLIPFYIPRNADWDYAWSHAESIRAVSSGGPLAALAALPLGGQIAVAAGAIVAASVAFGAARWLGERAARRRHTLLTLTNPACEVTVRDDGAIWSVAKGHEYDVSRRSYDLLDPAGRALFLVDSPGESTQTAWPIAGNAPCESGTSSDFEREGSAIRITNDQNGLLAQVEITLPDDGDAAELWTITLENGADTARRVKVVPYLEWVLNRAEADRGHTQYNRLFAEVEYAAGLNAVLAWDKHSKAMGVLASDAAPEGFLSTRVDFVGRARSVASPRVLETLAFWPARNTDAHPTFDPIGSLLLDATVPARGSRTIRLLIGLVADKAKAIDLVARHLQIPMTEAVPATRRRKAHHPIGHGEIPPGSPQPYAKFTEDGRSLVVRTPFTPRPFDHTMSNALGHVVVVTNRGLHTTSSVNAQQNRLTPDWSDTVTRELPGEAFYVFDVESGEWFSPTYHPLNDPEAGYEAEFAVDGTASFAMEKGSLATELTVFVPPDEPAGLYRLTIRNRGGTPRRLRVASYFQMVLAGHPEFSGPLEVRRDPALNALFFKNSRNTFRSGPAFVAMTGAATVVETDRGRFFGAAQEVTHPTLVEHGDDDDSPSRDDRPIAALVADVQIPARGETNLTVLLGQADDRARAESVVRKYRDPMEVDRALEATRGWWSGLVDTVSVETTHPEFDRYLDWLKYQALAERIWARRGFYQASGAFGFRDQLQDSVNLLWMDPIIARRQILIHASQQFPEGDVVHWFHMLQDGRTGFVGRTHASDNLLWLPWAVVEYVAATGDESLLDERTPFLESDLPFEPLPAGRAGMGFDPLRSSREESVYRHCLRAIDLVLDRRLGVHGLPLMGTGDWNDGLDEIGSEGKGESVWLGFFLYYILTRMLDVIARKDASLRDRYAERLRMLGQAIESTWRGDRYLRAFHDDGTEIGVKGSGVWEIDALTAAWAVMAGVNPERGRIVFETALKTLEREKTILLGWPPLREDTHPYLGRSSAYPEGVRENGMYCHGVQWLVGAARTLADQADISGRADEAHAYRETAYRLWLKISAIPHAVTGEIETYGGQPNQQAADMVTTFEPGRMIWNGYTGAAGWVFRQAIEGVLGFRLVAGTVVAPGDLVPANGLSVTRLDRDLSKSPLCGPDERRPTVQSVAPERVAG